jgi:chemotaxis protein CheD
MDATVRVKAGEFFATDRDVALVTVLGSCVAACLRDRASGIGGMNHFMLPRSHEDEGPASASARYGVNAMELLINELIRLGARRGNLEAKVFGGGSVVREIQSLDVGAMNARFVCSFLRDESIPVVASDLQGTVGRRVRFLPASGRAFVSRLGRRDPAVLDDEACYLARLDGPAGAGPVEFF